MKIFLTLLLSIFLAHPAFSCVVPTPITGPTNVCVGSTITLSNVEPGGGTWTSATSSVATVDLNTGVVSGVSAGITVITFTSAVTSCTVTASITSTAPPSPITSLFSVCQGLTTIVSDGVPGGVWSSSNSSVATISSSGGGGTVFGASPGTSVITYAISTCTVTTVMTVDPIPAPITGPTSVCAGSFITLSSTTPGGTWTSSNSSVATVGSSSGVVTGAPPGPGTTTISYTLVTGCTTSTVITVNPIPAAITGSVTVCAGQTSTLSDATSSGTWSSSNSSVATIDPSSGFVTGLAPGGTSTISYTLPIGCFITTLFTVNPVPAIVSGTTTLCAGVTTTLSSSLAGGTWSTSVSTVATIGSSSGVVTAGANPGGTTTITYSMSTGCFTTTVVTVNPLPATITGITTICAGLTTTLSNTTGGGTWTSVTTTVATVGTSSGIVTGVAGPGGTSIISYTLPTGCFTTTVVTVNPLPATITGLSAVCVNSTINLSNTTAGGTWSSSNSGVATIGSASGVVSGNTAGSTVIAYTLPTGCFITINITVNQLPTAIAGNTTICAGLTTILSNGITGGTWSSSNSSIATVGSSSGVVTGAAVGSTGTTTITYTLSTGCFTTTVVTVNPLPAVIAGTRTVCSGLTTQLSNITPGGVWSSANSTVATVNGSGLVTGGVVAVASTSVITYSITATGCIALATVTVNPLPGPILGNTSVCAGGTTVLSNAITGGTWTSSNPGVASIGSLSGLVTAASGPGGTTVITYTLGTGCIMTIVLTVNPLPASITGVTTICAGLTTTLSNTSTGGTWSSATTLVATVGSASGIVTGGTVAVTSTSTITYTLPTGCFTTTVVTVNPAPAIIAGPNAVCIGSTINLSNATTGGTWSVTNTNATIVAAAGTGVLTGQNAGLDTVIYSLSTGCIATKTVSVNVQPAPITGGPLNLCNGASASLSDITPGGSWASANTTIATVDPSTGLVTGTGVGITTVNYGMNGCTSATLVVVNIQPGPITGINTVCNGACTTFSNATPGGSWSSSNTLVATINTSTRIACGVSPGIAVITYTLGTCISVTTLTVNIQPGPISGTTSICHLSSVTLSNTTPGGTWSSNNTTVATVGSTTGVVTGQSVGTALISYTMPGGCSAARLVTINIQPLPIAGANNVCTGSTTQLSDATPGVVWSSTNISVATVSSTGLVGGVAVGVDTIIVTLGTCTAISSFTVNPLPSPMTGTFYLCTGSSTTLNDLTPSGTWSSSLTSVATIGLFSGFVTAGTLGTTNITYTLPTGCIATHTLTVLPVTPPILGSSVVCAGQTVQLSDPAVGGTWTSSNTTIAVIDPVTGLVTGVSAGTAAITYTLGTGCNAITPMVVHPLSPIIGVAPVCAGQTLNLSDATVGGTWSSSNSSVATIHPTTGVLSGVTAGTTIILYTLPTSCAASATITVLSLPAPIGGTPVVCAGSVTTLSNASLGGAWSSNNSSIATVDPSSGDVTGVTAGTTTITYTQGGCPRTISLLVNPRPAPITGNANICFSLTQTLSDAVFGGTWSSSSTSIATVDPFSGVVTGTTVGSATITYMLSTGCYEVYPVTVNPLPPPIVGIDSVCAGSAVQLSDAIPGGAWFSGNNAIATIGFTTGLVTGSAVAMTSTVVVTYMITSGCTVTKTITVHPLPSAIIGSNNICAGSTVTLFSAPAGGTWSSTNSSAATINPVSGFVTGVTAGITTISYTNSHGCASTLTFTVNALPDTIRGNMKVCTGMTTELSDATPGGAWSSSNTFLGTVDASGTVYGVGFAGSIFRITYTLPTGCFVTTTITIVSPPTSISGPTQVCENGQITLLNGMPGGTWTSSNSSAATIHPATGILSGVSAGVTIISYSMGGGSCYVTYIVTVNPVPTNITGITSVCAGLTTSLSNATPGGNWSSATSTVATIDASGTVYGTTAGTTRISYTLSTGCAYITTVTVNPLPAPITGNTNICQGNTRTLSDSPGPGIWSSANSTIAAVGSTTGIVTGNNLGGTIITYSIISTGCIRTTTVAVHPLPAVFSVTGGGSYCSGTGGLPVGLSGSEIGVNYFLYLGSAAVGPFAGTGGPISFGFQAAAGTYTVAGTNSFATCSTNMTGSAVITITPTVIPSVTIASGAGDTVCAGTPVAYTAVTVNGGSSPTYEWSVNSVVVGTGNTYGFIPANGDSVVVKLTSSAICAIPDTVRDTLIMTVLTPDTPSVIIFINPNDTVCAGTAVTFTVAPTYGGTVPVYLWMVNGTNTATGATYTYTPANGDIVYVKMVSNYMCRLADTVTSNVEIIAVEIPIAPGVSITASPGNTIHLGQTDTLTATVTNGGPAPTYQWFVNGVPIPGATTSTYISNNFSYPNEDSISCIVTNNGYCTQTGFGWIYIKVIPVPSGVMQGSLTTSNINVIPNPNKGLFTITGESGTRNDEEMFVELTDMLGQIVYKDIIKPISGKINKQVHVGNTIVNGMYMLHVHSANERKVFHIVIEQ